ncbi:MAG: molybdenum hydroxylase, partial [Anaerolineae bacterium]|nr:molybdenum hydroxylase [Anaerolineae bacterium]
MPNLILIQGGGDLATGIAYRLHKAGLKVLITEMAQPLSVRRKVSFCEAVYDGEITIEGLTGRLVQPDEILSTLSNGEIPVLVDPELTILNSQLSIPVLVDATLRKRAPEQFAPIQLSIGL